MWGLWLLESFYCAFAIGGWGECLGPVCKPPKLHRTGYDSFLSKNTNHGNSSRPWKPEPCYFYPATRNSFRAFSSCVATKVFAELSNRYWVSFVWPVSTLLVCSQLGVCTTLQYSSITTDHNFFNDCWRLFF